MACARQFVTIVQRELEEGVAGHQLDAGDVVHVARPDAVGDRPPRLESRVAVGERRSHESATRVEQSVVETPRVDPDRRERSVVRSESESAAGVCDEGRPVPSQRSIGMTDGSVTVSVDDDRLEGAA